MAHHPKREKKEDIMPRIRNIKPEFWTDEKIISVPRFARLLLIGMLNFADDRGVLEDSPLQLKVRIFPVDADIGSREIKVALAQMEKVNLIFRWEVISKAYIHICNFNKHQVINRPSYSPHPIPPDYQQHNNTHGVLTEDSRADTDTDTDTDSSIVTPNGVTRDILPNVTPPETAKEVKAKADFETWWKAFPNRRKVGKPKCYTKWLQLRRDKKLLPLLQMLTILERQKRSKDWLKDGGDFIPGPHPYLNQFMFMDESVGVTVSTVPSHQPAEEVMTPDNVHKYADPNCPECQGKGMLTKEGPLGQMRVRCACANINRKGERP
jgi:hypothetical protein